MFGKCQECTTMFYNLLQFSFVSHVNSVLVMKSARVDYVERQWQRASEACVSNVYQLFMTL